LIFIDTEKDAVVHVISIVYTHNTLVAIVLILTDIIIWATIGGVRRSARPGRRLGRWQARKDKGPS
jgi:hypothetical protein